MALPLKSYTAAQENEVANEIQAAPGSDLWPGFIVDYGALRADVRACEGANQ